MTAHSFPIPVVPGDLFARHQVITGLRALADFLETNPAVPVPEYGETFDVFPRDCDDDCSAALVDDVAALLKVQADDDRPIGGHYSASRSFGRITYRIVHIPDRNRRQLDAQLSYRQNIRLDDQDHSGNGRVA
ncbi:hypothetical protein [Actinomadura verrucosospora]|uniref:Uncharacterized protein n=1 Tax=Actinomadura verrucosospora TaxID=46165 RepID=A0A7D3ZG20_ACTVE|nr:hypothetical protein [Actinomadura verrucosospora]QKG22677.1 hypothetical protein ACTIVE_4318 [Actinomadura verrucosospora]